MRVEHLTKQTFNVNNDEARANLCRISPRKSSTCGIESGIIKDHGISKRESNFEIWLSSLLQTGGPGGITETFERALAQKSRTHSSKLRFASLSRAHEIPTISRGEVSMHTKPRDPLNPLVI